MTQLASLPVLDLWIAFNPTYSGATLDTAYSQALPSSGTSNSYWTNVSQYVRDFQKASGRQHYLDRSEAGTLTLTLDSRDGFFWNGTTNATGYVIAPRLPIALELTWSGTGYRKFFGFIESISETVADQVNVDLKVQASDQLKFLSLRYMNSPAFWAGYVNSASAASHFACTTTNTAVITAASGNGTTVTYTAFNNFSSGDTVTITGLGKESGATLNLVNVVVASAASYQFTVTNSTVGVASGTGSAYRSRILDTIGSQNGLYSGSVSFPNQGAIIYTNDGCVDTGCGSQNSTGAMSWSSVSGTFYGLDFWVLGQDLQNAYLTLGTDTTISGSGTGFYLITNANGYLGVRVGSTSQYCTTKIDDGYWHHVGVVANSSGNLELYCDGAFTALSSFGSMAGWYASSLLYLGPSDVVAPAPGAYLDEVVWSNNASLSTLQTEVLNRYCAGTLLQLPTNPSGAQVLSGDRIAEILCLAGYGTISSGAVSLNPNLYYINDSGTPWAKGTSGNGFIDVQPWYWDTPIYDSTALDLIYEICDTDIGSFFQKDDGTFAYYNQNYYGSWSWNSSTSTGTWTPNSYTPGTDHIFADDGSGTPYDTTTLDIEHDDADLWTSVEVVPQAGVVQIYEDTAAEALYGYSTLMKSATMHPSLTTALSTATFLGYLYRSPLPRVQTVTLMSETADGSDNTSILNCPLGDVVTFKRTPPGAAGAGILDFNATVEAYGLDFDAEKGSLRATYTLDPYPIRS